MDCVFDEDGDAIPPGTVGFVEDWAAIFNGDIGETLEAYFPQHMEEE